MTTPATNLALWIRAATEECLTHLKLQKLAFYCYGAALANDHESELGVITFDAWKHGPVNREIYRAYASYGAGQITSLRGQPGLPHYSEATTRDLKDALSVYGRLDAWSLRQESHLETPWVSAFRLQGAIPPDELKSYFRKKFSSSVEWPRHLLGGSSLMLDGIPRATYSSLHELAQVVRAH
jgi:uncharacterized phage-associated protein